MNGLVFNEGLRLLCQVESLDLAALGSEPIEISGKLRQNGIDIGATNTGRAAHRLVVDVNSFIIFSLESG